jgi:hypothetical protein
MAKIALDVFLTSHVLFRGENVLVKMETVFRSSLAPWRRMKVVGVSSAGEYLTVYVLPASTVLGNSLISRAAAATMKAAPAKRVWMKSILIDLVDSSDVR